VHAHVYTYVQRLIDCCLKDYPVDQFNDTIIQRVLA
jgi:hypothetical protein